MLSRVMVFSPIVLSPSCFWSAAGGALSVGGGGMAMLAGGGMAAASAGGRSSVWCKVRRYSTSILKIITVYLQLIQSTLYTLHTHHTHSTHLCDGSFEIFYHHRCHYHYQSVFFSFFGLYLHGDVYATQEQLHSTFTWILLTIITWILAINGIVFFWKLKSDSMFISKISVASKFDIFPHLYNSPRFFVETTQKWRVLDSSPSHSQSVEASLLRTCTYSRSPSCFLFAIAPPDQLPPHQLEEVQLKLCGISQIEWRAGD